MSEQRGSRFHFTAETAGGIKAYIEVHIDDLQFNAGLTPLTALKQEFERTATWLAEKGFKRDTSTDRPASSGGWTGSGKGGGRQEDVPPPGLHPAPPHCEKPMVFHAEWTNKEGETKAAKWTCRADKACPDRSGPEGRYPFTVWKLDWKDGSRPVQPADGGKKGKPVPIATINYGDFLTRAHKEYGLDKRKVLAFVGAGDDAALIALGPEGWLDMLNRMKESKREAEDA